MDIATQLVKPRTENKKCLSKGWVRGDYYSEMHKLGVGLFGFFGFYFFNMDTGRTDIVTKMFVTCLWHKSLRRPGKMQKRVQNTCQRRSKCPGCGLQQLGMHLGPQEKWQIMGQYFLQSCLFHLKANNGSIFLLISFGD